MTQPGSTPSTADDALALARQHHQAGRLEEAKAFYRQALAIDPRSVESLFMLGAISHHQGQADAALDLLRKALALKPDLPPAYRLLAGIATARNDLEAAIGSLRQGLAVLPDNVELESDLANMLLSAGRLDDAIALYRKVLARAPNLAVVHNNLGIALDRRGLLAPALEAFARAVAVKADYAEAHVNRANALAKAERHAEAVDAYRQAIALRPSLAEAHSNLASSLVELGLLHDAVSSCRRAIELNPRLASAWGNLGIACMVLGDNAEARAALEKAIALAPGRAKYHYHLSELAKHAVASPETASLLELGNQASLPEHDRVLVHFALGKVYDDAGQYGDAWRHFEAANRLHRSSLAYDSAASVAFFDRVRRQFSAAFMRGHEKVGNPSQVPVFIIGMPRSGTTLVEQILSSHPHVFGAGELPDFPASVAEVDAGRGEHRPFPESAASLSPASCADLGTRYLDKLRRRAPSAGRITDKLPHNFLYAGLIHLALPNAAIIHVRRHPADTCLSCFSKLFQQTHFYSYDLAELGRYYRLYRDLMIHWREVLPPGRILDVRYEDLVRDIEGQSRRMVAHCALEWDPACLAFWQNRRAVFTASHAQVRQPVFDRSIGRWRNYERFLAPLLAELQQLPSDG